MKLRGVIGPGRGHDSSTRQWPETLRDEFGYDPFPGTLNVRFQTPQTEGWFRALPGVIQPFRDFVCAPCTINGVAGHMCFSTARKETEISTVYVTSDRSLRRALGLCDRGWVEITVNRG